MSKLDIDDLLDKIEALGVGIMWHEEEKIHDGLSIMRLVIAIKEKK